MLLLCLLHEQVPIVDVPDRFDDLQTSNLQGQLVEFTLDKQVVVAIENLGGRSVAGRGLRLLDLLVVSLLQMPLDHDVLFRVLLLLLLEGPHSDKDGATDTNDSLELL